MIYFLKIKYDGLGHQNSNHTESLSIIKIMIEIFLFLNILPNGEQTTKDGVVGLGALIYMNHQEINSKPHIAENLT